MPRLPAAGRLAVTAGKAELAATIDNSTMATNSQTSAVSNSSGKSGISIIGGMRGNSNSSCRPSGIFRSARATMGVLDGHGVADKTGATREELRVTHAVVGSSMASRVASRILVPDRRRNTLLQHGELLGSTPVRATKNPLQIAPVLSPTAC